MSELPRTQTSTPWDDSDTIDQGFGVVRNVSKIKMFQSSEARKGDGVFRKH